MSIFLTELLVDSLFRPGVKLNPEHKSKYMFLLAYATSVSETNPSGSKNKGKRGINKEELKATTLAIDKVHNICCTGKGSTELIADLATLYQCIK